MEPGEPAMTASPFALTIVVYSRLRPPSRLYDELAALGLDGGRSRLTDPEIRAKGDSEVDIPVRSCFFAKKCLRCARYDMFTMCRSAHTNQASSTPPPRARPA